MKRTCSWCRVVYDDGLKPPEGIRPESIPRPETNHGICPGCAPKFEAYLEDWLKKQKLKKGKL